jgi:hypothetical protein
VIHNDTILGGTLDYADISIIEAVFLAYNVTKDPIILDHSGNLVSDVALLYRPIEANRGEHEFPRQGYLLTPPMRNIAFLGWSYWIRGVVATIVTPSHRTIHTLWGKGWRGNGDTTDDRSRISIDCVVNIREHRNVQLPEPEMVDNGSD